MITCISNKYTPIREVFATVEDFQKMCEAVFGERANLRYEPGNGRWVDTKTGETVLIPEDK